MRKYWLLLAVLLGAAGSLMAQQRKIAAFQVATAPKLDGLLNDGEWKDVPEAIDFITNQPTFGLPASLKTSVKVIYDNNAIYVGAQLFDDPSKVRRQLTARDQHGRADVDYFSVFLDTYKDRQNGFQFLVTSRNVQSDARLSPSYPAEWGSYGDGSWDAVWDSRVAMNKDGWSVEIRIPYSAIRFSKDDVQEWGIQFLRFARALNESSFWSPVDPAVNGFVNQFGELAGLRNLRPPLRLSLSPYISGGYRINPPDANGNLQEQWLKSGGMDVKWGVNESFTLDATLIPDFGQVVSDPKVNNLTPFDIQFQENRPFFTEGTELFNKADIFYSRRVGRTPAGYNAVESFVADNPGYSIRENPTVTPLYNAIKFSGRNKKNLGIGVFNAVARPVDAVIWDESKGRDSVIRTEELANYNVVVLDKALKNRSFLTFTNTNVLREGKANDANVTALDIALYDAGNRFLFNIAPRYSKIFGSGGYDGWANFTEFAKVSGKWQWSISNNIESDTYNPNDLGFLRAPNEVKTDGRLSYQVFTPTAKFLNQRYSLRLSQVFLYKPFSYQQFDVRASAFWLFKNFWDLSVELSGAPFWYNDYFELRYNFKNLKRPSWAYIGINGSTDSRKRLYAYLSGGFAESKDIYNDLFFRYNVGVRYRFSDKLSLELSNSLSNDNGQFGYAFVNEPNGEPVVARRKNLDVTTVLSGIYSFTPRMNMTVRGRHYWNKVTNVAFYNIDEKGYWYDRPFIEGNDLNVNIFNLDVFYVWDFRLGSRIVAGWKNWIDPNFTNDIVSRPKYKDNLSHTMTIRHGNEFTIRFIYFLDYQDLRKRRKA